jgi:hypothetical protein
MRPAAERILLLLSWNLCIDMVDYVVYVRLKARVEDEGSLRVLLTPDFEEISLFYHCQLSQIKQI